MCLLLTIVPLFHSKQASAQTDIACPLVDARKSIVNTLPNGWRTTPVVSRLSNTRVAKVGEQTNLICEYGQSGNVFRSAPANMECTAADNGFRCIKPAPQISACEAAVQEKISWNRLGNKRWNAENLARLCDSAEKSIEPARCFNEVMHGGRLSRGDGNQWNWQSAISLCGGSKSASATLSCFKSGLQVGKGWKAAAEFCSP